MVIEWSVGSTIYFQFLPSSNLLLCSQPTLHIIVGSLKTFLFYCSAIPLGRILLLDLASELEPIYTRTQGYFGHPFLWCMIENFGGNTRMYGMTDNVIQGNNALFNALTPLLLIFNTTFFWWKHSFV